MKYCHGCNHIVWSWDKKIEAHVLMDRIKAMVVMFHNRCFDSYMVGMATRANNPMYDEGASIVRPSFLGIEHG